MHLAPPQRLQDHRQRRLTYLRVYSGTVRRGSLEKNLRAARLTLAELESLGISMSAVTQQLEDDGVRAFADAFTALLAGVEKRRQEACRPR